MKKCLLGLIFLSFLFGCSSLNRINVYKRISILEQKVEKIEKNIDILKMDIVIINEELNKKLQEDLMKISEGTGGDSKFTIYPAYGLTGGGNAVDGIVSTKLTLDDGDACFAFVLTGSTPKFYVYVWDSDNTDTADNTTIIQPTDNPASGRWLLAQVHVLSLQGEGTGDSYLKVNNSSAPSSPSEGWFWYNTGDDRLEFYDGTNYYYVDSVTQFTP